MIFKNHIAFIRADQNSRSHILINLINDENLYVWIILVQSYL